MRLSFPIIPILLSVALIAPAKTFILAVISFATTFLLALLAKFKISESTLFLLLCLSGIFVSLSFLHMVQALHYEEVVDIVRLLPLFTVALCWTKVTPYHLRQGISVAGLLSVISVLCLENGIALGVFDFIHARDLDQSFGRHSGVFVNVATLGTFCLLSSLFLISEIKQRGGAFDLCLLVVVLYLMILSGSKTALILCFVYILSEIMNAFFKLKINSVTVMGCVVLLVGGFFLDEIFEKFYVIYKIFLIFQGGLEAASSLVGRLNIWEGYFDLMLENLVWITFGVPVTTAETVSTTFDSDLIWLFVRFGLIGLLVWSFFWIAVLVLGRRNLIPIGVILINSLFVGVLVNFQMIIFGLLILQYLVRLQNPSFAMLDNPDVRPRSEVRAKSSFS